MENPNAPESYRLFIAIPAPDEIQASFLQVQRELRRGLPHAQVRWSPSSQFHLTLQFLGQVETRHVDLITQTLQELCQRFPPLELQASHIGFFPSSRSPRVIWIGVTDRHGLLPSLQKAISQARPIAQLNAEAPEPRGQEPHAEFVGHITLGRIKSLSRTEVETLNQLATNCTAKVQGAWTGASVELVRSQLSSQGAVYTTLGKAALGGTRT